MVGCNQRAAADGEAGGAVFYLHGGAISQHQGVPCQCHVALRQVVHMHIAGHAAGQAQLVDRQGAVADGQQGGVEAVACVGRQRHDLLRAVRDNGVYGNETLGLVGILYAAHHQLHVGGAGQCKCHVQLVERHVGR